MMSLIEGTPWRQVKDSKGPEQYGMHLKRAWRNQTCIASSTTFILEISDREAERQQLT